MEMEQLHKDEERKQLITLCRKYNINNYNINDDNSINVYGDVNLKNMRLTKLPIKFNHISGNFDCSGNQMKSLLNSPISVKGDFNCSFNELSSLKYAPDEVEGNFICKNNHIYDLKYLNCVIYKNLDISNNELISFDFFPLLYQDFICNNNPIYPIWYSFQDKTKIELFNNSNIINNRTFNITNFISFLKEINKTKYPSLEQSLRKHWKIVK